MPRSLVLGNGSTLVGLDFAGQVRDFYFDYVGLENHMTENSVHKIGVWVDDQISWLDNGQWNIAIDYQHQALASSIVAVNSSLQIELLAEDVVYNEKNILIRKFIVKNKSDHKRTIKVFLNHQFRMYGYLKKDTVYFDPSDNTIVHYKGRRVAIIAGKNGENSFSSYSVGLSNIEGREGTWADANDGELSKNPIEHGTVDSTICFDNEVESDSAFTFYNWVSFAKTFNEAKVLHQLVIRKSPERLIETTQDYWSAWVNKTERDYHGLDDHIISLFEKSLLIMRTHVDNTGAIIASGDFELLRYGRDNYTYVWPRDSAFVAMAFNHSGYHEVVRRFLEFANQVITDEGYFFHRYRCDKSWGSSWHPWIVDEKRRLPIQEDETALVLYTIWHYYQISKDLEFIEQIYNPLIKKAANFILGFRNDKKLPFSSYDLWEMTYGTHTFTSSTVYGALNAACEFAKLLGKESDEKLYHTGAREVKDAIVRELYNKEGGYFHRSLHYEEGETLYDSTVDMSSIHGILRFDVLDAHNEMVVSNIKKVEEELICGGNIGGVGRFSQDQYYRVDENMPGNPWIITTLWLSQYYIKAANNLDELKSAYEWIDWVANRALPSGILPEQVNPHTGEQISATPLTWSHAEFVTTVLMYLNKIQELKNNE